MSLARWAVAVAAAFAAAAGAPIAQAADLKIVGVDKLTFDRCDGVVTLEFAAARDPVVLKTIAVAPPDATSPAPPWTIAWDTPVQTNKALGLYNATGRTKGGCPGSTASTIRIAARDAAGDLGETNLTIAAMPAPRLATPPSQPFTITRWPLIDLTGPRLGEKHTVGVKLEETSKVDGLKSVSLRADGLKGADGYPAEFELKPPAPIDIAAGATEIPAFTVKGTAEPGVYSGNVYAAAPGTGDPRTIPLTLKVRVHRAWLLFIIVLGVAAGWFLNVVLTRQLELETAREKALDGVTALARRAEATGDVDQRRALTAAAVQLQTDLEGAATAEDMDKAKAAADAAVQAADRVAAERATQVQQDLAKLMAAYAPPVALEPIISDRTAEPRRRLQAIAALVDAGNWSEAARRLHAESQSLDRLTQDGLRPWLHDVVEALDALGRWPEKSTLEDSRALLANVAIAAFGNAAGATLVATSNGVAQQLRTFSVLTAPPQIATILTAAADAATALEQAEAQTQLAALARSARAAATLGDGVAVLRRLAELRERAEAAIRKISETQAVRDHLDVGAFAQAVTETGNLKMSGRAAAATSDKRLVDTAPPGAPSPNASPPTSTWPVQIVPPARLFVDQELPITILWPLGRKGEAEDLKLQVRPAASAEIRYADGAVMIKATKAGTIELLGQDGATALSATFIAEPLGVTFQAIVGARKRELSAILLALTVILTILVGYMIFQQAWLGTATDTVSAFLWGALGQFGLERVRTAAQPVVSKTL